MNWNLGENRNVFANLKSQLGFCHLVLTTRITSSKVPILTVVENQPLPDIKVVEQIFHFYAYSGQNINVQQNILYTSRRTNKLYIAVKQFIHQK